MTRVHPRWARVVGGLWLAAGLALVLAGIVVIIDQHHLLRWELLVGVVLLGVGLHVWRRALTVDEHGLEQHHGWRRTRLLWSTVDRLAIGQEGARGGPVLVWRVGADQPEVLVASWGTTRHQRRQLAEAAEPAVGRYGIVLSCDVSEEPAGADDPSAATRPSSPRPG